MVEDEREGYADYEGVVTYIYDNGEKLILDDKYALNTSDIIRLNDYKIKEV